MDYVPSPPHLFTIPFPRSAAGRSRDVPLTLVNGSESLMVRVRGLRATGPFPFANTFQRSAAGRSRGAPHNLVNGGKSPKG